MAPEPVRALVDALEALGAGCADFAEKLGAASVHEHAFGKLIDAAKVRDAYHDRLPATGVNLAEAREVAESFLAEFTSGDGPSGIPTSSPTGSAADIATENLTGNPTAVVTATRIGSGRS